MPIIRFEDTGGDVHVGFEGDGGEAELATGSPAEGYAPTGRTARVRRVLAPVAPPNVFGVGLNYRRHAAETGQDPPPRPILFMKPTTAVIGPGEAIRIPPACARGPEVDYEAELAVVVGRGGRNIPAADAIDHVLGYTCANDVSARRWQKHAGGGQMIRGKGFDTFCPLGPRIALAAELGDARALEIRSWVNGELRQSSSTADMIYSVAELVAYVSLDTTLLPGTVILTGTPEGVGVARTPPSFLAPGDEVAVEVERVGRLVNPVSSPAPR